MGSSMDSRYWVCPSCNKQFDWESKDNSPESHNHYRCADKQRIAALESQLAASRERVKELEAEQEASKAFQEDVEATHRITLRDMQRELAALSSRADQDRADAEIGKAMP